MSASNGFLGGARTAPAAPLLDAAAIGRWLGGAAGVLALAAL